VIDAILGIDISKKNFHATLLQGDAQRGKAFPNNAKGFEQLFAWLRNRQVHCVHACLEATGSYGDALATALHDHGHVVSVVNPARIKGFAQSEMSRNKTDAVDAGVIARFCKALSPSAWVPPSPEIRALQSLSRRLASLEAARQQELNRAGVPGIVAAVAASINAHIAHLDEQIKDLEKRIREHIDQHPGIRQQRDLLLSIPGIGEKTAERLLGELPDVEHFSSAKQVSAFAGLTPQHRQSGSSVKGRSRISKRGNAELRKALFFPALSALQHNPLIICFAQRLRTAGKTRMVIVAAAMRKLLHIAYGILKSGRPFDPQIAASQA
jgi:transposase